MIEVRLGLGGLEIKRCLLLQVPNVGDIIEDGDIWYEVELVIYPVNSMYISLHVKVMNY